MDILLNVLHKTNKKNVFKNAGILALDLLYSLIKKSNSFSPEINKIFEFFSLKTGNLLFNKYDFNNILPYLNMITQNLSELSSFLSAECLQKHLILILSFLEIFLDNYEEMIEIIKDSEIILKKMAASIVNLWKCIEEKDCPYIQILDIFYFIKTINEKPNFKFLPTCFSEYFYDEQFETSPWLYNEHRLNFISNSIINFFYWKEYMVLTLNELFTIVK